MIDNSAVINRQTEQDSVNVTFTLVNKVYLCFCTINYIALKVSEKGTCQCHKLR